MMNNIICEFMTDMTVTVIMSIAIIVSQSDVLYVIDMNIIEFISIEYHHMKYRDKLKYRQYLHMMNHHR